VRNKINLSRRTVAVHCFFLVAALLLMAGCRMPFDWRLDVPSDWGMDSGTNVGDEGTGPGTIANEPGQPPVPGTDPDPAPVEPERIVLNTAEFTLMWDPPAVSGVSFKLYSRPQGSSTWSVLLDNLVSPQATINQTHLSYGTYEFAVSSVNASGDESVLHTSLDANADPSTGWFIEWVGA